MASSTNSSGRSGTEWASVIQAHTKECLEEMKKMPPGEVANVIILIGRTGVGKSALLEYLTDSQGHSKNSPDPVTLEFQLERVNLAKRYYIMDTPGFDTDTEQAVFHKLVDGIEAVRRYTRIIGVLLVTRINDGRAEAVDNRLVAFVDKLCGPSYAAQVTAVTNFWNVSEPEDQTVFEARLQECLQRWRAVLGDEMKQYQHGRRYSSSGEDTGECLKWRANSDDIKEYAKAMIDRHYSNLNPTDPLIVQEMSMNKWRWETAAGEFLGIVASPQSASSSSRTSASSSHQAEAKVSPPNISEAEGEGNPKPSASAYQANSNQCRVPPQEESWGSLLWKVTSWAVDNVLIPMADEGIDNRRFGVQMTAQTGGGFSGKYDPLSSVDHFKMRGMASDLGSRTKWAREHGINLEPGTQAFGDAVRNAIQRERPL